MRSLSDDESLLPRVDRAARAQPRGGRARAQPAPVRRVAAAREPAHGRTRASCAPRTRASARWGPRRSPSAPAASCSPPARPSRRLTAGHARRPDPPGDPGRAAGPRRAHQPGDRRPAVHQPAHRRVPPAQGVPQARRQQPQGAPRGAREHVRSGPLGLCLRTAPRAAQRLGRSGRPPSTSQRRDELGRPQKTGLLSGRDGVVSRIAALSGLRLCTPDRRPRRDGKSPTEGLDKRTRS